MLNPPKRDAAYFQYVSIFFFYIILVRKHIWHYQNIPLEAFLNPSKCFIRRREMRYNRLGKKKQLTTITSSFVFDFCGWSATVNFFWFVIKRTTDDQLKVRSSPFGKMAAEPKGQSTYRPSTIDVISREVRVGTVCVCACWRGGGQKYKVLVGEGGIKRLRDLAISELKESWKIGWRRRRKFYSYP